MLRKFGLVDPVKWYPPYSIFLRETQKTWPFTVVSGIIAPFGFEDISASHLRRTNTSYLIFSGRRHLWTNGIFMQHCTLLTQVFHLSSFPLPYTAHNHHCLCSTLHSFPTKHRILQYQFYKVQLHCYSPSLYRLASRANRLSAQLSCIPISKIQFHLSFTHTVHTSHRTFTSISWKLIPHMISHISQHNTNSFINRLFLGHLREALMATARLFT